MYLYIHMYIHTAKMQEAIHIFAKQDADGSGAIDVDELADATAEMETFTGVKANTQMIQEALHAGGGEIGFSTFVRLLGVDTGTSDSALEDQVERAYRAFQVMDVAGVGSLGPTELNAGLGLMGIDVGHDEMRIIFDEVDEDESGEIGFLEFCRISGIHGILQRLDDQ